MKIGLGETSLASIDLPWNENSLSSPRIIVTNLDKSPMTPNTFSIQIHSRKLFAYAFVAMMLGGVIGGALWNIGGVYIPLSSQSEGFGSLQQFRSYEDLKNFLKNHEGGYYGLGFELLGGDTVVFESITSAEKSAGQSALDDSFSGTNVQVEGVDEADLVKTDGTFIYLVKDDSVFIVIAYPPEEAEIVGRINMSQPVLDIYISGDKLLVFSHEPNYLSEGDVIFKILPARTERTTISVYDVSDCSNPIVDREITVDGYYFNSRMIGKYVYFIIRSPARLEEDEVFLPTVREEKVWYRVSATDIYYPNSTYGWLEYNMIMALNIEDPEAPISQETFLLDSGSALYVSPEHLYITSRGGRAVTTITKIRIDEGGITFAANGTVDGYVLNQFSMDEYESYFRIATTNVGWNSGREGNNVYVLDDRLRVAGSLTGIAPGEEIYSARFIGPRCYLVTFKKVDPLFTIDLSDPEDPTVLGKLKIPGFSNYLHPYDENILIGVGQETEEAKEGDFAWFQGVKISLFDVSDVANPVELAKMEVGDRGSSSPAQWDHHAFLLIRGRDLLIIPILEARIDEGDFAGPVPPNVHGEYVYQGAYIFQVSPEGIELRGRITHIDDQQELMKSGYRFNSEYEVVRSLYIEDTLYTISRGKIMINSLEDLSGIGEIELK